MKLHFLSLVLLSLIPPWPAIADTLPEIRIVSSVNESIVMYEAMDYWGELDPHKILEVPPYMVVATAEFWRDEAAALPVAVKKELFYRSSFRMLAVAAETTKLDV